MAGLFSLFFFLLFTPSAVAHQDEAQDDFLKTCPPSTCGSLEIRFPLRLQSAPASCGHTSPSLTCSAKGTLLISLPPHRPFKITSIDYAHCKLAIELPRFDGSPCPLKDFGSLLYNLTTSIYGQRINTVPARFFYCPAKFEQGNSSIVGPIPSCDATNGYFVYVAGGSEDTLPLTCPQDTASKYMLPSDWGDQESIYAQSVDVLAERREVSLGWDDEDAVNLECRDCELGGKHCGLNWQRNQTICISHHGLNIMLITGTSIGGFLLLLSVSAILLYVYRQSRKEKETRVKVEKFLATYETTKPTRYTCSEIKNMTKQFKHRLGQGGFGSVYKGELPNGIPVAVKMLEKYTGEGKEFINEMTTIGRIHHVNIVRLLGFSSEGTRCALVYELMPNQSLEKYIFSKEGKRRHRLLSVEKLLEIATGIARGIEYLHQGCEQRILHFDIKPHNILLDHNFTPKVSDFGLAKLCSKDNTIITMTAARGTLGYMAPEVFSRNFGEVSYKSDVYSFGMLLLEMVSGKRTVEPTFEKQVAVYFPEWIYSRLIRGEDLGLAMEKDEDRDITRKITIVALWCIQWNPNDRPTMTRVVQLLTGDVENLEIPPKPFVSAHQDNGTSTGEV